MPDQITIHDITYEEDKSQYPVIIPAKPDWSTASGEELVKAYAVFTVGGCPYGWIVTKRKVSVAPQFCRHHWDSLTEYQRKRRMRRSKSSYNEMSFHRFAMVEGIGGRMMLPTEIRVADGQLILPMEGCRSADLKNNYRVKMRIVKDYEHLMRIISNEPSPI